jgi:hypothetical protein
MIIRSVWTSDPDHAIVDDVILEIAIYGHHRDMPARS